MLSLHTKRKHLLTALFSVAVVLSAAIFAGQKILTINGAFAVDYPMPAGFNDQVFYDCIVEQFKSQFPGEVIPDTGLTDEQLAKMTSLNCNGAAYQTKIADTSGLEKMVGLTSLNLSNNTISSIDLSSILGLRNLQVGNNSLSTLDVSDNNELRTITADYNSLTAVNLSNRTNLVDIDLKHNQISSLDVSNDSNLKSLIVDYNTIESLNTTNDTALTTLKAYNNKLDSLDLSTNTNLTTLQVDYNQFTSLDLTGNTNLVELRAESNPLTSLNINGLTSLKNLYVAYNSLSDLDFSTNTGLVNVEVYSNNLTSLNLSNSLALGTLKAYSNQLNFLTLPETDTLTLVDVNNNQLSEINVSGNPSLTSLAVQNNQLSALDVSNNPALLSLSLQNNAAITNMDITNNTALTTFRADNIPVRTSIALSSFGETTAFDLNGLKFLKATQMIPSTEDYTYNSVTKTLMMTNGYTGLAQINAVPAGLKYKLELPMYLAYDIKGGEGVFDTEVCYLESGSSKCNYVISDSEPTKEGNHFLGWSTNSSATTVDYVAGESVEADDYMTLYAVWSPIRTLSYNLDGGSGEFVEQTCYNETDASAPCNITISSDEPSKGEFKHFLGWNDDSEATTANYAPGTVISMDDDKTLYAKWTVHHYLSYDMNGAAEVFDGVNCYGSDTTSVSCDVNINSIVPTKDHRTFLGWANEVTAETGEYQAGQSLTLSDNSTTIHAIWGVQYTLNYELKGGSGTLDPQTCSATTSTVDSCTVIIHAGVPEYEGLDFYGWSDNAAATVAAHQPNTDISLNADKTIYAVWGNKEIDWDEQDFEKGTSGDIVFRLAYSLNDLEQLLVDSNVIPEDQFIIDLEENTVSLRATYLDTLSEGDHSVQFVFNNGKTVSIDVTVKVNGGDDPGGGGEGSATTEVSDDGDVILDLTTPMVKTESITVNIYNDNGVLVKTINIDSPSENVRIDVEDLSNGDYTAEIIHKDEDGNIILTTTQSFTKTDGMEQIMVQVQTWVDSTEQIKIEVFDADGNVVRTIIVDTETGTVYIYDKDGNLIGTTENAYVDGKMVLPMDGLETGIYSAKVTFLDKDGRVIKTIDVESFDYEGKSIPVPDTGGLFGARMGSAANVTAISIFATSIVVAVELGVYAYRKCRK